MAIKLIKACKELNIGMSTAIEFLWKLGHYIAVDPSVRIDDDLYLILAQEFNKDRALKLGAAKVAAERQKAASMQPISINDSFVEEESTGGLEINREENLALNEKLNRPDHNLERQIEVYRITHPKSQFRPKVVDWIDLADLGRRPRFRHQKKDVGNTMQKRNFDIERQLENIPWVQGVVTLFNDREYGLIKSLKGETSFFHPSNCLKGEIIEDGDFVLYKPFVDPLKDRLTAYLIRHPKEEDGFTFILDYFWRDNTGNRRIVSTAMVRALQSYSVAHWAINKYTDILLDTKPYLLECDADYTFETCCKALVKVQSLGLSDDLNADFLRSLSQYVLPDVPSDKLVPIFQSLFSYKEKLFNIIEQIEDPRVAAKAVEAFFTGNYRNDAEFIIAMENHNIAKSTCSRFRDHYATIYADLRDEEKAWLYIIGYDLLLKDEISDVAIAQTLEKCDDDMIAQFYNTHKDDTQLVTEACVSILREHSGWDGSSAGVHLNQWTTSMPQLVDDIIREARKIVDGKYVTLWKNGIVPAPSKDEWLNMMLSDNKDPIRSLNDWFKLGYVDKSLAEELMHDWYISKLESTRDVPEERFAFDFLLLRKYKELNIKFNVPKHDSEYLPIIEWYENVVNRDSEKLEIDFDQLSKYFYLFSESEQVKILRYIFFLMKSNFITRSLEPLISLTSQKQQMHQNDDHIHVCFDVDLVIEAMFKFQERNEFFVERDLLMLLLTNLTNEDFRERTHPLIYQLFDNCEGIEWRKYVDVFDDRGRRIGKKKIERNYGRPYGVIFCEGRELEKKDEMGNTRYWCRNTYCAKSSLTYHADWREYTMYDFCRIIGFNLSEIDYAGHRCENGKYLKFVSLINRFNQFAEHLYCRECGRLMMPSKGLTNLTISVSSHYECINNGCSQRGVKVYLSHCLNPDCQEPIDERDTKKCPNGWVICGRCSTCCSHQVFARRLSFLQEHRPASVSPNLVKAVENHIGHLEKEEYYCPKCGTKLEKITGRSDIDYACTNPTCKATFLLEQFHRTYKFSSKQQDE